MGEGNVPFDEFEGEIALLDVLKLAAISLIGRIVQGYQLDREIFICWDCETIFPNPKPERLILNRTHLANSFSLIYDQTAIE